MGTIKFFRNAAVVLAMAALVYWLFSSTGMLADLAMAIGVGVFAVAFASVMVIIILDRMFGPTAEPDAFADADVSGWGHYKG